MILVGEMRDLETISTALTAAETGHLVFATLHTQSTAQTVDRIIDVFPPEQQGQVRTQLSIALQGIVTQQLLPTADGRGRTVACEVLIPTPAIRNLIREGKTHQIYAALQTSGAVGMQTMDADLARLVRAGQDHPLAGRTAGLGARGAQAAARRRGAVAPANGRAAEEAAAMARRPHRPRPSTPRGPRADGRRDDIRVPGDGPGRRDLRRRARGRFEGRGHRAAAPARPDRPRRQREDQSASRSRTSSSAGRASTCASWRSSRASSRP